jgi:hypothetical protein
MPDPRAPNHSGAAVAHRGASVVGTPGVPEQRGQITAALFDFGGVILSSPFDAFADYEREHGLPHGFIRGLNATDPDHNAGARMERN